MINAAITLFSVEKNSVFLMNNFYIMLAKQKVLKSFKEMPEQFSIDDAIDKLIVIHKIQSAETEIKNGKGLTTVEAKKKLKKWLN